jgi:hypothetical protein
MARLRRIKVEQDEEWTSGQGGIETGWRRNRLAEKRVGKVEGRAFRPAVETPAETGL